MRVRLSSLLAVTAGVAAIALVCVGAASATLTHEPEPFSPLTGAGSGLTFSEPEDGIAIDEATGNVFIADGSPGNQVAILGGEGGAPAELAPPFSIGVPMAVAQGTALAYDGVAGSAGKGTLYVYNKSTEKIDRYIRNAMTESFELAGEMALPGAGSFTTTAAIDLKGDLYVASYSAEVLFTFSPSGAPLAKYALASTPSQMVFDNAGDLFAAEYGDGVYKYPVNESGEIEPGNHTQFASGFVRGVAYDPVTNHLYATYEAAGHKDVSIEYNASTGAKISEFGRDTGNATLAVNSATGRIYGAEYGTPYGDGDHVNVYGPLVTVPTTIATVATNVTGTKATLNGSVNPEGIAVSECRFEYGTTTSYGKTAPCEGSVPTNSEANPVSANISGLTYNGVTYHYRVVAKNANGTEYSPDKTLVTSATVTTEPASGIGTTTATLNGLVRPEGLQYSECNFEYGLVTSAGYEDSEICHPSAAEIEPDFTAHALAFALTGLQANSTYKFRLTAANANGKLSGKELTFTTLGPPQIAAVQALNATQTAVTLQARINPDGLGTRYRFEWGTGATYGNDLPAEFEPYIGSGTGPITVRARLSGLSPETVYHYRVVAVNVAGPAVASSDQELETLDSCGLPDGRCFEMVSPREPGLAAIPTEITLGGLEPWYQAGAAPGSLTYLIDNGLPDATRGTEDLYRSIRGEEGWEASQLSPPIVARNESGFASSNPDKFVALSPNLTCGFMASVQPLSENPAAKLILEEGGSNLYRVSPDGSYTLITDLPPEAGAPRGVVHDFEPVGMASDCSRFVFFSDYVYPGVPGVGSERLYEWSEAGGLKNVSFLPNGSGETAVEVDRGQLEQNNDSDEHYGAVSEDGSRVFFMASRIVAGNPSDPGEVGKRGVFVREDGTSTRDVSASATSTPDTGATYEGATPDGSHVYFLANAGLTTQSSGEGSDLYEYDLDNKKLTDLSVDSEVGGAEVKGLIRVADNGSRVYFLARGQLVPGRGGTFAQNTMNNTFSVYEESGAKVHFVGAVSGENGQPVNVIVGESTSRVSPDGRYLLFESSVNVTGYESGGASEAYLYDADTGATVCVSCRPDGRPSVALTGSSDRVLAGSGQPDQPLYAPRSLVVRNGEPLVFFSAPDALAPGAVEGHIRRGEVEVEGGGERENLYEWAHGQLYLIAAEPERGELPRFYGASEEGTDIYFSDGGALTWEDPQGRLAAWDARAGGGFAEPPAPAGCDPVDEGSCQGAAASSPGAPSLGSLSFSGPGNVLLTVPGGPAPATKPKSTGPGKSKGKKHGKKRKRAKPKHKHQHRKSKQAKPKSGHKHKESKSTGSGRGKGAARKANRKGRTAR